MPSPIIELDIERLSQLGEGVGKYEDRSVFVPGALPGEQVRVQLDESGKVLRGEVIEVQRASPSRRAPSCPVASECGGCDWLHVAEPLQREAKLEVVLSTLEHLGGIARHQLEVRPLWASPRSMGYRRRAVLHLGGKRLGFFGRRSHHHVAVDSCPALTDVLAPLPGLLSERLGEGAKDIESVTLLEEGGQIGLAIVLKGGLKPRLSELVEKAVRELSLAGAVVTPKTGGVVLVGKPVLKSRSPLVAEFPLFMRPDAFAQANSEANDALVAAAVTLLAPRETDTVLELFCGNGNFTFPIGAIASEVLAVESSGVAIELAQRTAREGQVRTVRFVQGDVKKVCDGLMKEGRQFQRMLLDPPRVGAPGLGKWALSFNAEQVVYVACDPASLARDAAELVRVGFQPQTLQVVDMFPQTRHIEAVLSFWRDVGPRRPVD